MKKILPLLLLSVWFCLNLSGQDYGCYKVQQDRTGYATADRLDRVIAASSALKDTLPKAWQSSFTVIEDAQYFLSGFFAEQIDSLEARRYREIAAQHTSFLFISRRLDEKGNHYFKTWLKLPEEDIYPCVTQGLANLLSDQVAAKMNTTESFNYVEQETAGINLLIKELDKALNCCSKSASGAKTLCTKCDFGFSLDRQFDYFDKQITDVRLGGRFTRLDNIRDVQLQTDVDPEDEISVEVTAYWKELPGYNGGTTPIISLTSDLRKLKQDLGNDARIRVKLFDESNCSELLTTLGDWTSPGPVVPDFTQEFYSEEIIVLSLGGRTEVYSRIRSASPEIQQPQCDGVTNFASSQRNSKLFLPAAIVVREILKRALMGAVSVFVDVALNVTIEKVFHQISDSCEDNSWGEAWNRYKEKASGWQLFFTFLDGAINTKMAAVLFAGLEEATNYIINPNDNNFKSSSNFKVYTFFDKFARGCAKALISDQVLGLAGYALKAIKKLKKRVDIPENQKNVYIAEMAKIFRFFFEKKEKGVTAYVNLLDLPPNKSWVRTNVNILGKMTTINRRQQERINRLYKNILLPSDRPAPGIPPFSVTRDINGFGRVTIDYDEYGFPNFDKFMRNRKIRNNAGESVVPNYPEPLVGRLNGDLSKATNWALQNFPSNKVRRTPRSRIQDSKKNTIDILDENGNWVTHTWHHHQNGKNLFLVPSKIHNANSGNGFAHSGGETLINGSNEDKVIGLFDDPVFD